MEAIKLFVNNTNQFIKENLFYEAIKINFYIFKLQLKTMVYGGMPGYAEMQQ